MTHLKIILLTGLIALCAGSSMAQDFVYTPKNPAFGGHYLNHQWLMSSAQAQNSTQDPNREDDDPLSRGRSRNSLEDFEQSLNRQILNQLSRQLVQDQFGESTLKPGNYQIGTFELDVTEGLDGLSVVILDVSTGNETSLFIPYY